MNGWCNLHNAGCIIQVAGYVLWPRAAWLEQGAIFLVMLNIVVSGGVLSTKAFEYTFTQSKVQFEVKPVFPNGGKFHCSKQGTLFPKLNIANKFCGLPLETHAIGLLQSDSKPASQYFNWLLWFCVKVYCSSMPGDLKKPHFKFEINQMSKLNLWQKVCQSFLWSLAKFDNSEKIQIILFVKPMILDLKIGLTEKRWLRKLESLIWGSNTDTRGISFKKLSYTGNKSFAFIENPKSLCSEKIL